MKNLISFMTLLVCIIFSQGILARPDPAPEPPHPAPIPGPQFRCRDIYCVYGSDAPQCARSGCGECGRSGHCEEGS